MLRNNMAAGCLAFLLTAAAPGMAATIDVYAAGITNNRLSTIQIINGETYVPNTRIDPGLTVVEAGPLVSGSTRGVVNLLQFDSFTGLSAGAQASANLATGKLGAGVNSAASGQAYAYGDALARFSDRLTFVNAGTANVQLAIEWAVTGTIVSAQGGSETVRVNLTFGTPGISPRPLGLVGASAGQDTLQYIQGTGFGNPTIRGQWSNDYTQANPVWTVTGSGLNRTMKSTIVFLPGTTIVDWNASISVDCRGGSMCDFSHTAGLTFGALPEGLTYSSESGVFLSEAQAVPEPGTWGLMLVGGMVAGWRARRKKGI